MKKALLFISIILLPLSVQAQNSDWSVYAPWPQGNSLNSVCALSENTAVAVGENASILKTTDGGVTWTVLDFSFYMMDFNSVFFYDALNGWIVGRGESYRVFKTTNGGESWEVLDAPANNLNAVYFVSPTIGWTIGINGHPYKSTDGGYTWIDPGAIVSGCNDIFFIDADTGWAVTTFVSKLNTEDMGWIYKTTNGGTVWSSQSLPISGAYAVHFTSPLIGIVCGPNGGIARTTDGGASWYPISVGTAASFYSIDFADAQYGWITGESGVIYYTMDGGENWAPQTSGLTSILNGISAGSTGEVWAVGNGGNIIKTIDGGALWTKVSRTLIDGDFYSMSFPNEMTGWALATDYGVSQDIIFRTTDGGQTWYQAASFAGEEMIDLFSTDDEHCWSVGLNGTVHYTTDGGVSWLTRNAGSTLYLNSVFFINNSTGWACGPNYVYKTINGGDTWFSQDAGSMVGSYSIFFIDANTGWLATENSFGMIIIKKTTDGGNNWDDYNVPSVVTYAGDIKFIDAMTGFAVGNESSILKTTDGGVTWELKHGGLKKQAGSATVENRRFKGRYIDRVTGKLIQAPKSGFTEQLPMLWAIGPMNSNSLYAVGEQGTILKSTNGGDLWALESSGTNKSLNDVTFPAPGRGWAVGANGTILKYEKKLAAEPEAQPTNLNFTDVTTRGFRAQFDHASPMADGYIAVRRLYEAPDYIPVDGTTYKAGDRFGLNEIAYVGADNFFIENMLLPNQEYYYKIFAFNGSGESINYLTVNPLEGSQTTLNSNAIFVTNPNDYMEGSLRWAIDSANSHIGPDTILFALPKFTTLYTESTLDYITDSFTVINGDMDEDGKPDIILSGSGNYSAIMFIESSHNVIQGLVFNNYYSEEEGALVINQGHYNKIIGNYFGTDPYGNFNNMNETGIQISNGSYNQIGDGTSAGRNIISGNLTGVWITGESSRYNQILGNYIGLNAAGMEPLPNQVGVVLDNGAKYNQIGSHDPGGRNLFCNFADTTGFIFPASVMMGMPGTDSNYVIGNRFGLNAEGGDFLDFTSGCAVGLFMGVQKNFIGDGTVEGRNVIANHFMGIQSISADSNYFFGNYIGTDTTGLVARSNEFGMFINGSGNIIGNATEGGRNVIAGNDMGIGILGGDFFGGGPNPKHGESSLLTKIKGKLETRKSKYSGLFKNSHRSLGQIKKWMKGRLNTEGIADAQDNRVIGNYIGVGADGFTPIGNQSNAFIDYFDGGEPGFVTNNTFEYNVIANSYNAGLVIGDWPNVYQNRLYGNTIYNSLDLGILIGASAQESVWPPHILNYDTLTHILSGNAASGALVQIYADYEDEGQIFIDTTYADASGNWSKFVMPVLNMNFTALQDSNGNTSAFSEPFSSGLSDPLLVSRIIDNNTPGTLRYAMEYANTHPGPDVIRFSLQKGDVIQLTDVLPAMSSDDYTTIDGDIDADGSPDIVVSGFNVEGSIFLIYSSHNTIKGMVLKDQNFNNGAAITIDGGHYNKILGCYIGTDITGMAANPNYCGVKLTNGAMFNQIGDGTAAGRNVIAGNRDGIGIRIMEPGTNYNVITGNFIGLNAAGTDSLPNQSSIMISGGARGNIIGGHTDEERNYIYSQEPPGGMVNETISASLFIMGDATDSNYVTGNWFGLNIYGSALSGHNIIGVTVWGGANNFIGDGLPGGGNVIANSDYCGLLFHYADSNYVYGNLIGTDPTGTNAIPNESGVVIRKSSYNQIGGNSPWMRNVISGNNGHGVAVITNDITGGVTSVYNKIIGNVIGLNSDGVSPLGNTVNGIYLKSESGWSVAYNEVVDNVIANNGGYGVSFNSATTYQNTLFRNSIYNNTAGIYIDSVAQNQIPPPVIDSIVGHMVYGSGAFKVCII